VKPPYAIPSMSAINAIPHNGFSLASTFSGCGGSCLGFRWAGFRTLWASEFIAAARDTYRLNHPDVPVDARDIRTIPASEILDVTGLAPGDLDVLEGSPPCASFSTAGTRQAGWGEVRKYSETRQRTDDLFDEFARLVRELQPKVFVAENVLGLVRGAAKGYFLEILSGLRGCGYRVEAKGLEAQWLGVPQTRGRLIFVGVREDIGSTPVFPKPGAWQYSIRDACPWVASPKVAPRIEPEASMSGYAVGREWRRLSVGESSERYFSLVRSDPDKPCGTITQSGGNGHSASVAHPYECRKFSIAELRRLCGFPDDFRLPGTYAQQYERLGRAVPPPMMRAIAESIREGILCKL
jgi:DNA (cytosine-5)-methyltransferase 1